MSVAITTVYPTAASRPTASFCFIGRLLTIIQPFRRKIPFFPVPSLRTLWTAAPTHREFPSRERHHGERRAISLHCKRVHLLGGLLAHRRTSRGAVARRGDVFSRPQPDPLALVRTPSGRPHERAHLRVHAC